MSKLSKNLSAVKITDSVNKVVDAKSRDALYEDWERLIEVAGKDAVLTEVFQQLSTDELSSVVESLKSSFDINDGKWGVYDAEGNELGVFDSEEEANEFADDLDIDNQVAQIEDSKKKVTDEAWSEADHAAAFAINADDVVDLYLDGIMELEIPSGIDSKEFAESCIKMCKELWSDEEVNFDYGDVEFNYVIDNNKLIITII